MDTLDAANVLNIKVKLICDIIESQKFDIVGVSEEFRVYNTGGMGNTRGYYDIISSKKYELEKTKIENLQAVFMMVKKLSMKFVQA